MSADHSTISTEAAVRRAFPRLAELADEKGYVLPARPDRAQLAQFEEAEKKLQDALDGVLNVLMPFIVPEGGTQ